MEREPDPIAMVDQGVATARELTRYYAAYYHGYRKQRLPSAVATLLTMTHIVVISWNPFGPRDEG